MVFRPHDRVVALFDGTELVEPGVVTAPRRHPDPGSGDVTTPVDAVYAGVARVLPRV